MSEVMTLLLSVMDSIVFSEPLGIFVPLVTFVHKL